MEKLKEFTALDYFPEVGVLSEVSISDDTSSLISNGENPFEIAKSEQKSNFDEDDEEDFNFDE